MIDVFESNQKAVSASTLVWTAIEIYDPDGGKYILWPHLPCIESPVELRPDPNPGNLALLASSEDLWRWKEEETENEANPGAHVAAASASGTTLGRYLSDLLGLGLHDVRIPDPEPMRLLNDYDAAKIFHLEPSSDDPSWADLMVRHAEQASKASNFLALISTGRRWRKLRTSSISRLDHHDAVDPEIGAAAASAAAWWAEEQRSWTKELIEERDLRIASRLRGAMRSARKGGSNCEILVPIHQARLNEIAEALSTWPECEDCEEGGT